MLQSVISGWSRPVRRLFHRCRASGKQPNTSRHKGARGARTDRVFFLIDSHLFFVGALPASCVRLEHRLSSGVGGRRDEGGRVGRLGWRLGWGWGKGSAPWLGACQQELGWGMLGPGEEGGEAGVLT